MNFVRALTKSSVCHCGLASTLSNLKGNSIRFLSRRGRRVDAPRESLIPKISPCFDWGPKTQSTYLSLILPVTGHDKVEPLVNRIKIQHDAHRFFILHRSSYIDILFYCGRLTESGKHKSIFWKCPALIWKSNFIAMTIYIFNRFIT
jgi:hypothetical protein